VSTLAQFKPAFEKTFKNEGYLKVTNQEHDFGGETYAGISRRYHPEWVGWGIMDVLGKPPGLPVIQSFYRKNFWNVIKGTFIESQEIAEAIYDYAVNVSPVDAIKTAQRILGVAVDGIVGPKTLKALNRASVSSFLLKYTLLKIKYYTQVCEKDHSQRKFLVGWLKRALQYSPSI